MALAGLTDQPLCCCRSFLQRLKGKFCSARSDWENLPWQQTEDVLPGVLRADSCILNAGLSKAKRQDGGLLLRCFEVTVSGASQPYQHNILLRQVPVSFSSPWAWGFIAALCFLGGIKAQGLAALRQEILYSHSSKDFMLFDLRNALTPAASGPAGMITRQKSLGEFRLLLVTETWERKEVEEKIIES